MTPESGVPVVWVDAFAERPFGGNPAAVCLLDEAADDRWMQALATELGLSETAFVWPQAGGLWLRWFTPATEVALCGHATLAAAHALRQTGHWRHWPQVEVGEEVHFRTRRGTLVARFDGPMVEIDLPAEAPVACDVPEAVAAWGAAEAVTASGGDGPSAFAGDRRDLVVALDGAAAVRSLAPDLAAIARLPYRVVVATAPGDEPGTDYVLRVFGPAVGVDEDPVTGSAQCLLGPYWSARLGRRALKAAQLSARRGRLQVVLDGDRVRVSGQAVTVLTARLTAAAGPPVPPGAAPPGTLPTMGIPEA